MLGGGFGGFTINLVKEEAIDKLVSKISEAYGKNMNIPLSTYYVSVENGTAAVV